MYTWDDIFEQAAKDSYSIPMVGNGYKSYIGYQCKITKDIYTHDVRVYNIGSKGMFYDRLNEEEAHLFLTKGWKIGSLLVSLSNYRAKLEVIEFSIHREMNGSKNPKHLLSLRRSRESIMRSYSQITKQLQKYGNS